MQHKRERVKGILHVLDNARSGHVKIEQLYLDLLVPFEIAELLEPGDKLKRDYFDMLNEAVSLLDLRDLSSVGFVVSLNTCRAYLEQKLYNSEGKNGVTETGRGTATVIGSFRKSDEGSCKSVFGEQIGLLDRYPWYKFMAGEPAVYGEAKEKEPGVYERIKARNAEGRWETEGSVWQTADCNLCSGETIIRSILKGKMYFRNEFGMADGDVLWSPEVCGCTPTLPQILKKTRTKYFLTTGSHDEMRNLSDSTFLWRGIDGSGILTHVLPEKTLWENSPIKTIYENDKALTGITRDNSFSFIGGEDGPDSFTLEIIKRLMFGLPGMPNIKVAYVRDYFKRLDRSNKEKLVPVWCGELPLKRYRGTYSDNAETKKLLRCTENALSECEYLSSIALLKGFDNDYPSDAIDEGYRQVISGKYEECRAAFDNITGINENKLQLITEAISKGALRPAEEGEECGEYAVRRRNYLYVYNTTSFLRDDMLEIEGEHSIFDEEGRELAVQFSGGKTLAYVHDIPARGYKVYVTEPAYGEAFTPENLREEKESYRLHTPFYYVTFNKCFEITGLYDKAEKREVFKGKSGGNVLRAYEDRNAEGYKGDIDPFYSEKSWRIDNVKSATLVENGPVRYTVRVVREFNRSEIIQNISFYAETKRIDFRTEIKWLEPQLLLKAFFPLDLVSDKATYDVQFGNIERYTHENAALDKGNYEVFAHKWVDISEYGYGCGILNDGRYGCSARGTTCTLTLFNALKAGEMPEETEFTYSLFPHNGDFRKGHVVEQGYFLNNPLKCMFASEPQKYGESWFFGLPDNVVLETVKLAGVGESTVETENVETGEVSRSISLILRLYEAFGCRTDCSINSSLEIKDGFECDMLEYSQKRLELQQGKALLNFKPYEIKTIKLIMEDVR